MNKESAEEKLLRLIKGSASRKDKQQSQKGRTEKPVQEFETASYAQSVNTSTVSRSGKKQRFKSLSLASLNHVLRILIVLIVIFFIFDIAFSRRRIDLFSRQEISKENVADFVFLPRILTGEFADYSANIKSRDIFRASQGSAGQGRSVFAFNPAEYISNIKLLGIISGKRKQAIIEDANEKKNYTLSVGDSFKEFLVEEIGKGKVRLDYKGEKFDLFL